MVKCNNCSLHHTNGYKHICEKNENKTVYGILQDQFIEGCLFYCPKNKNNAKKSLFEKRKDLINKFCKGAEK